MEKLARTGLAVLLGAAILIGGLALQGDLASAARIVSPPGLDGLEPLAGSTVGSPRHVVVDGIRQRALPCTTSRLPSEVLRLYERRAERAGARYLRVDRSGGVATWYASDGAHVGVVAVRRPEGGTSYWLLRTPPDAGRQTASMERAADLLPGGAEASLQVEMGDGALGRWEVDRPVAAARDREARRLTADGWRVRRGEDGLEARRGEVRRLLRFGSAGSGRTVVTAVER